MEASEALEMYEEYKTYWEEIYKKAKSDQEFYSPSNGTQWDATDIALRPNRPCLTVNVLPQFVHQVTNQIRQNTPSINVLPSGDGASQETAKILKGLIRNIEYRSGADEVYDTAAENAVISSFGFILVDHDYVSPDSSVQELLIKRAQNPLAWMIDPSSIECDGCDQEGAVGTSTITRKAFEKKWKDKPFVSFETGAKDDAKRDAITLGHVFKKDYEDIGKEGKRTLRKVIIRRYTFSGQDMLEETTFPGEYIPVVPVYGEERWVDGKRNLISLIRGAKDPQRRYNHWASVEAEILSKSPIAPFIAEAGSIEDFAEEWQNPSKSMVLRYKNTSADGSPANKPERSQPISVQAAIINAMQGAYEDIKRSMGLYDASVGQKSNETSGVAINARKDQGDVATFHFPDNLKRSVEHVGRILTGAAPAIYDTARIIQIIGDEDEPQLVSINGEPLQPGQDKEHDLTSGKYDARVTTGPSYTTKMQEAGAKLGELIQANPANMGVFGDLWVKNLDIPGADAIAARIRKTIPPALTAEEDAKKNGQQPPSQQEQAMAQQIQQMQQQIQEMGAVIQQNTNEAMKLENEKQKNINESERIKVDGFKVRGEAIAALHTAKNPKPVEGQATPETSAPPEENEMNPDMPPDELMGRMEAIQTPQEMQAKKDAEEMVMRHAEIQLEQERLHLQQEQGNALIFAMNSISKSVAEMKAYMNRPVQVIRDPNTGMITGGAPVMMQ